MTVEGVDYAFSKPSAAALVAAGKRFAVRYGGPGTSGKWLTAGELRSLVAAGLTVVANAEGAAGGFVTRSAGVSWAKSAELHFRGLGMPADRPIYFSVDFDVTAAQWPGVAEALRGAASVIGSGRVGIYGSYNAMVWARRDGLAAWFWQTYAWSKARWAQGNHLEQYRNGVTIGGADCDLTRALTADFGQWPGVSGTSEGKGDMSEHIEAVIDAWRDGRPVAADGSNVEPVNWRIRDEEWQKSVDEKLAALFAGVVKVDAAELAAALLAQPGFAQALAEAAFQGAQRAEDS